MRQRLRRRVLVELKSGGSFAGVLFDADRESLVLRNAEALGIDGRGERTPVDGEVLILREEVAFLQIP
jgi:small nuclear ribonucleoprotein (snRNP)-like protein